MGSIEDLRQIIDSAPTVHDEPIEADAAAALDRLRPHFDRFHGILAPSVIQRPEVQPGFDEFV